MALVKCRDCRAEIPTPSPSAGDDFACLYCGCKKPHLNAREWREHGRKLARMVFDGIAMVLLLAGLFFLGRFLKPIKMDGHMVIGVIVAYFLFAVVFWVTLWDRFAEYLIRRGEDDGKHINENPRK